MSKIYKKRAVFEELKEHCHLSKEDDFVEVTEWKNGEGVDIALQSWSGSSIHQFTYGEFDLIKKLVSVIEGYYE